jgi:hypothetical protein
VDVSQNRLSAEPQLEPIPNLQYDTEMAADAYPSAYNNHPHPSSNTTTVPSSKQDRSQFDHIDPSLIPIRDGDQFVDTEPDQCSQLEEHITSTNQPTPPLRVDAETTLMNWSRFSNYDQISDHLSSEYTQGAELPDPDLIGFKTFEMTAGTPLIVDAS